MTEFDGTIKNIEDISTVTPPDEYVNIWKDISQAVQERKALNYGLTEEVKKQCFTELQRRPYYLSSIA